MAISAPRLYRKPGSGVYFARVLLGPVSTGKSAGKTELRRSLRTKCPILAGRIIGTINAVLAQVPMSHRAAFYDDVHRQILDRFIGQESYKPFTAAQLKSVFEPTRYLMECRDADHFWAPLLGVHLGVRLGEIVTLQLDAIQQHALSGIWYADIRPEMAKNTNSVRRLPITQPLVDLGFIDYVQKLKTLGAGSLFPHRDMSTTSAIRQPSKNTSEKFARFLDVCGVTHKDLVFHSFRHTVVTALQYGGVPLHVSQQIVGHMAQDHAIKTGELTQEQARSVTFSAYTHTDIPSLTVEDPFKVLKDALEKAVRPPLDYPLMKRAAAIVLQHVRKTPEGFESGWAPQDKKYSQEMTTALTGDDGSSI